MTALRRGLTVARDRRSEGHGGEARNPRGQAQVLEAALPLDEGSPRLAFADKQSPGMLQGLAG